MRDKLPYFPALQGARGLAVLAVIGCHLNAVLTKAFGLDSRILASGWNGVYFFFVLSGFLIGRNLLQELKTSSRIDFKFYFKRRLLRTWPAYFAVILIPLLGRAEVVPSLWAYLTFTQNFWEPVTFLSSWTLASKSIFIAGALMAFASCECLAGSV